MADQRVTHAAVITDPTTSTQQMTVDASGNAQVKVNAALPAGTNSIGDIGTVSTVTEVATVDAVTVVNEVIPGTGATDLGKAEDAAHASGDTGVMALGVRKDTAAALAGTDGDYMPFIMDSSGRIYVTLGTQTVNVDVGTPTNPAWDTTNVGTPVTIAAGSGSNLDSADLASKKLRQAVISMSVPFKVTISTLSNGAATPLVTLFGGPGNPVVWSPPHEDFAVSGSSVGADGFRAAVTNLDAADSADAYASFAYND